MLWQDRLRLCKDRVACTPPSVQLKREASDKPLARTIINVPSMRSQTDLASGSCPCSPLRSEYETVEMLCKGAIRIPHNSNVSGTSWLPTSAGFISENDKSLWRNCQLMPPGPRFFTQPGWHGFGIGPWLKSRGTGSMFHRKLCSEMLSLVNDVSVAHIVSV